MKYDVGGTFFQDIDFDGDYHIEEGRIGDCIRTIVVEMVIATVGVIKVATGSTLKW